MFHFQFFIFSTTFLFLLFSSIYDIKKRIIPNFLILFFLIIGFFIKIIESIIFSNINILLNSLLSFIIIFIISFIFWESGFFAGGDLKLFCVVAILNPFNLNFLNFLSVFGIISNPIFPITLLIVSILVTAPILIINSLYLFIFKKHHFLLWEILKSKDTIFSFLNSVLVLFFISSFLDIFSLNFPIIFYLLFSIILLIIFKKIEKLNNFYYIMSFFYTLLIITSIIINKNFFSLISLITIIITIKLIYFFVTIYKIISTRILSKRTKLKDLKEGDVPTNNYYKINKKIVEKRIPFFKYLKEILSNTYYKNLIIDSRKAKGFSKEDITFLKRTYNNLNKEVCIKKTIPFTPSVLVAYVLLNILGDFIWFLF
jgi:Flp pilus assembly protein protease CpaA